MDVWWHVSKMSSGEIEGFLGKMRTWAELYMFFGRSVCRPITDEAEDEKRVLDPG